MKTFYTMLNGGIFITRANNLTDAISRIQKVAIKNAWLDSNAELGPEDVQVLDMSEDNVGLIAIKNLCGRLLMTDTVSREVFNKEMEALRAQIEQLKLEKAKLEGMLEEARRHQTWPWPITPPPIVVEPANPWPWQQQQPYTITWGDPPKIDWNSVYTLCMKNMINTTNSTKNLAGEPKRIQE